MTPATRRAWVIVDPIAERLRRRARPISTACNTLRALTRRGTAVAHPTAIARKTLGATQLQMRYEFIADAIARYSQQHPAATDSDVGIAEWWLSELGPRVSIEDVREALKLLERRGVMETVTLQDGRVLWRPVRRPPV